MCVSTAMGPCAAHHAFFDTGLATHVSHAFHQPLGGIIIQTVNEHFVNGLLFSYVEASELLFKHLLGRS